MWIHGILNQHKVKVDDALDIKCYTKYLAKTIALIQCQVYM